MPSPELMNLIPDVKRIADALEITNGILERIAVAQEAQVPKPPTDRLPQPSGDYVPSEEELRVREMVELDLSRRKRRRFFGRDR